MTTNTVTLETLNTTLDKILYILQQSSAKSIIYQYFMPYASKLKRIFSTLEQEYKNQHKWKQPAEIEKNKASIIVDSKSSCESIIAPSKKIIQDTDAISGQWKDWLEMKVNGILNNSTRFMEGLSSDDADSLMQNFNQYEILVTRSIEYMKRLLESDIKYVPYTLDTM